MARHLKIHDLLSREQLDELESFAREPGRTVDEVQAWLGERGQSVSRGAVWNWKVEFDLNDRMRRAAEISGAYVAAARTQGVEAIAAANVLKLQQMIFEWSLKQDEAEAGDLLKIAMALRSCMGAHQQVEELKAKQAEAVKAAETAAATGASAGNVVETIRKALGIAA